MRAVFGLVLILGLGLAGFAVYMVKDHFDQQSLVLAQERAAAAEIVPTTYVIAVNRVIGYGERIRPEDVEFIHYVEAQLPDGVFLTQEELFPQGPEQLRMALRQMEPREPILAVKVTEPGEDAGITTRLAPGMRAFTIAVDASTGVSGFLRPGDRVDVYWTGMVGTGDDSGQEVTKLIDTALELVAVDQSSDVSSSEISIARTVTVQVSPQQVANLAQAQSTGSLSLSLVGQNDETVAEATEVNQRRLLGIVEAEQVIEVEAVPEQVCSVRTRRGAEVVDIAIPCTN